MSTTRARERRAADVLDYGAELPEHRRRLVEANLRARRAYRPAPYAGRVTLFKCGTRPLFGLHDPETGWRLLTGGRVDTIVIPATYDGVFRPPHVDDLASALQRIAGFRRRRSLW